MSMFKNLNKIIICITLLALAILALGIGSLVFNNNSTKNRLNLHFSEDKLSDDRLVDLSDMIIKGKVVKQKEKSTKTVDTTGINGEKYSIEIPYLVYEMAVNDDLYNPSGKKTVDVVIINGSGTNLLDKDKDYVVFLEKVKREDIFKDSYQLVSYSQGVYTSSEDIGINSVTSNNIIHSVVDSSRTFDYDNLKNRIKTNKANK